MKASAKTINFFSLPEYKAFFRSKIKSFFCHSIFYPVECWIEKNGFVSKRIFTKLITQFCLKVLFVELSENNNVGT